VEFSCSLTHHTPMAVIGVFSFLAALLSSGLVAATPLPDDTHTCADAILHQRCDPAQWTHTVHRMHVISLGGDKTGVVCMMECFSGPIVVIADDASPWRTVMWSLLVVAVLLTAVFCGPCCVSRWKRQTTVFVVSCGTALQRCDAGTACSTHGPLLRRMLSSSNSWSFVVGALRANAMCSQRAPGLAAFYVLRDGNRHVICSTGLHCVDHGPAIGRMLQRPLAEHP